MRGRGNKKPGLTAKVIFALIVVAAAAVIWLGVKGIEQDPSGPPRGSQTLSPQAAQASGQAPRPSATP